MNGEGGLGVVGPFLLFLFSFVKIAQEMGGLNSSAKGTTDMA